MTEEGRDQALATCKLLGLTESSPSAATAPSGAPWLSPDRPPQPVPP